MTECGVHSIVPNRSQAISLALLQPPYRTFLINKPGDQTDSCSIWIYCVPRTVTEYLGFASEAALIRSKILEGGNTVVALYDSEANAIVGGSSIHVVLEAVSNLSTGSNTTWQSTLAAAALLALGELDAMAVSQAIGPSKRQDKVLVVGSGGREHAICVALAKSPLVGKVICCPGNGGTASEEDPKICNMVRKLPCLLYSILRRCPKLAYDLGLQA